MTYLYVAGEVLLINAVIILIVALIIRKAVRQMGQMFKSPSIPTGFGPAYLTPTIKPENLNG